MRLMDYFNLEIKDNNKVFWYKIPGTFEGLYQGVPFSKKGIDTIFTTLNDKYKDKNVRDKCQLGFIEFSKSKDDWHCLETIEGDYMIVKENEEYVTILAKLPIIIRYKTGYTYKVKEDYFYEIIEKPKKKGEEQ